MTTITMRGAATARIKRKKGRRVSSLNTLQDNSIIDHTEETRNTQDPEQGRYNRQSMDRD